MFWIVFSVIHIFATLLLSTQLYYMGRWKLGEGPAGAGWGGREGWHQDGPDVQLGPGDLPVSPAVLTDISSHTHHRQSL